MIEAKDNRFADFTKKALMVTALSGGVGDLATADEPVVNDPESGRQSNIILHDPNAGSYGNSKFLVQAPGKRPMKNLLGAILGKDRKTMVRPDLSKVIPETIANGITVSNPESLKDIDELMKDLDPSKPTIFSFTAKLCIPCKYVKSASQQMLKEDEYKGVRDNYNLVQINEENGDNKLTLSYRDKDGELVTKSVEKNKAGFMNPYEALFNDMATMGGRGAMTPAIGVVSVDGDSTKVKVLNSDPYLEALDNEPELEGGAAFANKFIDLLEIDTEAKEKAPELQIPAEVKPKAPEAQVPTEVKPKAPEVQVPAEVKPKAPEAQVPAEVKPKAPEAQVPTEVKPKAPEVQVPAEVKPKAPEAQVPAEVKPKAPEVQMPAEVKPKAPEVQVPAEVKPKAPEAQVPAEVKPKAPEVQMPAEAKVKAPAPIEVSPNEKPVLEKPSPTKKIVEAASEKISPESNLYLHTLIEDIYKYRKSVSDDKPMLIKVGDSESAESTEMAAKLNTLRVGEEEGSLASEVNILDFSTKKDGSTSLNGKPIYPSNYKNPMTRLTDLMNEKQSPALFKVYRDEAGSYIVENLTAAVSEINEENFARELTKLYGDTSVHTSPAEAKN